MGTVPSIRNSVAGLRTKVSTDAEREFSAATTAPYNLHRLPGLLRSHCLRGGWKATAANCLRETGFPQKIDRYCKWQSHERIDVASTIRIQDLPAEDIAALLSKNDEDLPPQQAAALREFVDDIGGWENACAAVAMLCQLRDSA
jgi:hypothetical protein